MSGRAAMRAASSSVRAYFAPVDRVTNTPTRFDAAADGRFALDAPPSGWISLGAIAEFRRSALTEVDSIASGAKGSVRVQARRRLAAEISFEFCEWGKLQMALACGATQMNVLNAGSSAVPLMSGLTASELVVGAAAVAQFAVGDIVAVDLDYAGTTGYLGSGIAASYLKSAIPGDADYVRCVTLNVGRVKAITTTTLQLEQPLVGGVPVAGAKAQKISGFVDREGDRFFQEWSGLFVCESEGGGRLIFYYPRLQAATTAAESADAFAKPLMAWSLATKFRALPVSDSVDGEEVLCYRVWLPATAGSLY